MTEKENKFRLIKTSNWIVNGHSKEPDLFLGFQFWSPSCSTCHEER